MWRIYAMASAEEENGKILKFYLYAKPAQDDFSCIELQFNKMDKSCTILTKSREEVVAKLINLYVKEFLSVNQLVY